MKTEQQTNGAAEPQQQPVTTAPEMEPMASEDRYELETLLLRVRRKEDALECLQQEAKRLEQEAKRLHPERQAAAIAYNTRLKEITTLRNKAGYTPEFESGTWLKQPETE